MAAFGLKDFQSCSLFNFCTCYVFNLILQMIMFGFAMFLDLVRALMWPFPWAFCIISVFIKNVTSINISLITLTLTTTRFVFIFGFKRIPVMEDRFWATLLYMVTTMISFFASAIRFYLPGRQTLNEVTLFLLQNLFRAESSFFLL